MAPLDATPSMNTSITNILREESEYTLGGLLGHLAKSTYSSAGSMAIAPRHLGSGSPCSASRIGLDALRATILLSGANKSSASYSVAAHTTESGHTAARPPFELLHCARRLSRYMEYSQRRHSISRNGNLDAYSERVIQQRRATTINRYHSGLLTAIIQALWQLSAP